MLRIGLRLRLSQTKYRMWKQETTDTKSTTRCNETQRIKKHSQVTKQRLDRARDAAGDVQKTKHNRNSRKTRRIR